MDEINQRLEELDTEIRRLHAIMTRSNDPLDNVETLSVRYDELLREFDSLQNQRRILRGRTANGSGFEPTVVRQDPNVERLNPADRFQFFMDGAFLRNFPLGEREPNTKKQKREYKTGKDFTKAMRKSYAT